MFDCICNTQKFFVTETLQLGWCTSKCQPLVHILSQKSLVRYPYHIYFLILSSHLRLCRTSSLFPSDVHTETSIHSYCPPYVLHTPPIYLCLTTRTESFVEYEPWSWSLRSFLQPPCISSLLQPNIFLRCPQSVFFS